MRRHANKYRPIWRCCRCVISAKFRRYVTTIFAHNSGYAIILHRVFGNLSCYFVSDWLTQILCPVPYGAQPSTYIKQCAIYGTLRNGPNNSLCNVTFARKFLHGKQTSECAVVVDCFRDPGWRRIRCCTVFHRSEVMPFNCGLSNAETSVVGKENWKTSATAKKSLYRSSSRCNRK